MFKISRSQIVDPYFITKALPCHAKVEREDICKLIYQGQSAFTLWYNDKVVAVIGASMIHEKSAYGWSYLSEDIKLCKKSFAKTMRDFINEFFKEMKLNRFFVAVDSDNTVAIRQNEWMGLEKEAVLRCSGIDGKDQVVLSRVRA
jgi:RimJ/RimL family protein N-acetyltransferase